MTVDTGTTTVEGGPDPAIVEFVARSGLVSRNTAARFERLPGGVSSDIWLVSAEGRSFCVKRALKITRGRLKGLQSREEVIAKYYAQHPDMKAYVDDHVIGKTCLYGIRELRKREEKNQKALQAQRSTTPPKPTRNPEME